MAESSGIYVKKVKLQTGGISKSASSLSLADMKGLEEALFGIPKLPTVHLNITKEEIQLITLMLNHYNIDIEGLPIHFWHESKLFDVVGKVHGSCVGMSASDCIALIEKFSLRQLSGILLDCGCDAHVYMDGSEDRPLEGLLSSLQMLDCRTELKDQSGAQCIRSFLEFIFHRQGLKLKCVIKDTFLQVSCLKYDAVHNTLELYNATPDFSVVGVGSSGGMFAVGEIESSPYVQMVVASLGNICNPLMKYLAGMCISKTRDVQLYLIVNELKQKIHSGQTFLGDISIKQVTTESFNLKDSDKLMSLCKKIASLMSFITTDYITRYKELQKEIQSGNFNIIDTDPEPELPRRSERLK